MSEALRIAARAGVVDSLSPVARTG